MPARFSTGAGEGRSDFRTAKHIHKHNMAMEKRNCQGAIKAARRLQVRVGPPSAFGRGSERLSSVTRKSPVRGTSKLPVRGHTPNQ